MAEYCPGTENPAEGSTTESVKGEKAPAQPVTGQRGSPPHPHPRAAARTTVETCEDSPREGRASRGEAAVPAQGSRKEKRQAQEQEACPNG